MQLSNFNNRGFLYFPAFLNEAEVKLLKQDFEAAKPLDNGNYHIRRVSHTALNQIAQKLDQFACQVCKQSDITVDQLSRGVYFPNWKTGKTLVDPQPGRQKFPWHQDHESYFSLQDLKNYLNFYIPLIKPVAESSNLSIIPLDRLQVHAPEVAIKMLGRGATRVVNTQRGDIILDDDRGGIIACLNFPIAEIEETPHLQVGDLLLLRGDVLHRTQDTQTQRVAVSLRMFNSNASVDRHRLAIGGVVKTLMMLNNWRAYELRFRYFDMQQSQTARAIDLQQYLEGQHLSCQYGHIKLLKRLFQERRSARKLLEGLTDLKRLPLILKGIL